MALSTLESSVSLPQHPVYPHCGHSVDSPRPAMLDSCRSMPGGDLLEEPSNRNIRCDHVPFNLGALGAHIGAGNSKPAAMQRLGEDAIRIADRSLWSLILPDHS
jgi:hypothetical protein